LEKVLNSYIVETLKLNTQHSTLNTPLLALLGLGVLVAQLAVRWPAALPAVAPTPTPLPAQVQTTNPKIGVHTRLTDEADPAKIRESLRLVREMGAPWVTEYFPWVYIQPSDAAHFDW